MRHLKSVLSVLLFISAFIAINSFIKAPSGKNAGTVNIARAIEGNSHVNGGGTTIEGGKVSTFVFNAVQHSDGSVNGHLNYKFRFADIDMSMEIDCFTITGNRATLTGTVSVVTGDVTAFPFIVVGATASFTVQDNGQGNASSPDLISDLIFGGSCASNWRTYLPISGNLTVKE